MRSVDVSARRYTRLLKDSTREHPSLMAHQSLYRKYRPATFDDVVGQSHIERTLRNAVAEDKVAHAYLFTGPRGTGKTTTARLLAKALLCERGPTSEPDGTCQQCKDVAEGTHPDVFELDAASRTGVDNVREEIIGRVQYAPSRGSYKIYIIDEVHMLSTQAFNALLKTLEEPPKHVVFVMCTTHPHKVPETIHSRCQRFDFHRISVEDIADHLRFIAEAEGFNVDRGAFTLIAKHAAGGMRDAITALEQLASFSGGEITVDDVEGMLGEVDSAQIFEVAGLIAHRDIAGCFRWIADTVESGTDLAELVRELTGHVRDLYLFAAVGDAAGFIDRTANDLAALRTQAAEFGGPDRLARVLDLLGELASELRWSSDPRLSIEVALTRMARPQGELTIEALAERIEMLERMRTIGGVAKTPRGHSSEGGRTAATAATPEAPEPADAAEDSATAQPEPVVSPEPEPAPCIEVSPVVAGKLDRGIAKRKWQAVLMEIRKEKPAREATFAQVEVDVDSDGQTLVLEFPEDPPFVMEMAQEPDNRDLLRDALVAVYGAAPPFRYQRGRGSVKPVAETAPPTVQSPADESPEETDPSDGAPPATEPPGVPDDGDDAASGDLASVLQDQYGMNIVAEHPAEPDEGEQV